VRVAIILNPIAGVRNSLERTRRRAEHASDLLLAAGADPEILITAHAGHARELAAGAVERGARLVVAWGGDGTVNEVATALAFRPGPARRDSPRGRATGSRGTSISRRIRAAAIRRLLSGTDRVIDVGELNGRLFVNLARSRLRRARGRALRVAPPLAPRLPAVRPHRLSGAPAVSGRGIRDVVRWRTGVQPSRVPDLVRERAPVGQRRHHRAGCRHRRRLPRRRRRERTTKATVLRALPRLFRGLSIVHPVCRFDAWNTRASRASSHCRAMSMVS
jgi:hypothetical protein